MRHEASGTTDLAHMRLLTRESDERITWAPDYGDSSKGTISCQSMPRSCAWSGGRRRPRWRRKLRMSAGGNTEFSPGGSEHRSLRCCEDVAEPGRELGGRARPAEVNCGRHVIRSTRPAPGRSSSPAAARWVPWPAARWRRRWEDVTPRPAEEKEDCKKPKIKCGKACCKADQGCVNKSASPVRRGSVFSEGIPGVIERGCTEGERCFGPCSGKTCCLRTDSAFPRR